MNNRGQVELGLILMVFITVLVGAILLTSSAQQIGDVINTKNTANTSFSATNATNTSIQGKNWADLVVYNTTNDEIIGSGNYTLYNNIVVDGEETARLEKHADHLRFNTDWLISGTVQETTYISNSGGRAITTIIPIFFALIIVVVALMPTVRNKLLESRS